MKIESIKAKIRREARALGHDLSKYFRYTLGGWSIVCHKCRQRARIRLLVGGVTFEGFAGKCEPSEVSDEQS